MGIISSKTESLADAVSALFERATSERQALDNSVVEQESQLAITREKQTKTASIEQHLGSMLSVG